MTLLCGVSLWMSHCHCIAMIVVIAKYTIIVGYVDTIVGLGVGVSF
jgi:hypothetical protein